MTVFPVAINTIALGSLLLSVYIPIAASAAEVVAGPPAEALAGAPIEEIVVFARKKEEKILEVPISVSAFSSDAIQNLGLTRLDDVARYTPGFSSSSATGRQPASNRPTIRGLTTIRNGIANTSAATVFIDGVYIGGSPQSTELTNLERVEILRGPQSSLYGRGTYAGAINYITRRPGEELAGEVTVTGAEYDSSEASGWIGGPINDQWAFNLAAGYREYGGDYTNERDGSDVGGEKSSEFTGKLYWMPADSLDISLKLGFQQTDDDHFAAYLQPRGENNCCFRTPEAPRAREYYDGVAKAEDEVNLYTDLLDTAGTSGTELDRWLAALTINWTLPNDMTLTSLTGYVNDEIDRGYDTSYAAYDPFNPGPPSLWGAFNNVEELEQSDFSQEFRLSSSSDAPLTWTAGMYYYSGDYEETSQKRVYLNGSDLVITPGGNLDEDEIENMAVFGGAEWAINSSWTTGLELRWAKDEIDVTSRANDASSQVQEKYSNTSRSLTPRGTVSYRTAAGHNYYLSIAKGVKPGDFNTSVPDLASGGPDESYRDVDEEKVWNYELGVKGQWWEQRLTAALAVYYQDIDDQQLTTLVELPDGGTASIIRNVGETEVLGFESDFQLRLSDALTVNANYAYTHAKIRDGISPEEADLRGSDGSYAQTQALGDISGNYVPRVPKHMASVVARYQHSYSAQGLWYLSGDYTFESSRYAQVHNLIETGNQNQVGLRGGVESGHWDANIWVKNIFDDDTAEDVFRYFDRRSGTFPRGNGSTSPHGFVVTLPRPRQVGATLRYRF
jgi:iron complex outermembrane receptor protein